MDENSNGTSRIGNWFRGLRAEFQKIVWPDRATLGRQTVAVILVTVILAIIIAVLDFGIQHGIDFLVTL
ncbi:MAG: preprotein translocase subunit SecE [Lachnospiraceae bacterium]|nr:preprotein translocase subunit SecE [Lachnospiraceae bacterium]